MPRARVKRRFLPVKKVPTWRFEPPPEVNYERMSALTRYLYENEESGLSRDELMEQFHEYDCTRQMEILAKGNTKTIIWCPECGHIEVKNVY